jgi:hypothetical protein
MSDQGRAEEKPARQAPKPAPVKAKWCLTKCGQGSSVEAKRAATAILEVLAGVRTPTQAAQALGLSVMRYYQVEARAVQGLVTACEPQRRGPGRSLEKELRTLGRQHERLQRELGRQQALARMAQRSIGLAAPPPSASKNGSTKRRRRPAVRGLRMVKQLRQTEAAEAAVATRAGDSAPTGS